MEILEGLGIQLIHEDDLSRWRAEKEGREVAAEGGTEDTLRLYMRQMGRAELLTPDEERRYFESIEASEGVCREVFNGFKFAAKMYAGVLDRLEGQSVRFDHVVSDAFEGDRDAYMKLIGRFRRDLARARSPKSVARCFERMCFNQKTLESLCEEALETRRMSKRQHRELWQALKDVQDSRARIVEANLRLVVSVVKKFARGSLISSKRAMRDL